MNDLHNADAGAILPTIPTDSIDMIFTDPPYNTTDLKFDKNNFNLSDYLASFARVIKPSGWFFCFGTIEMYCDIINSGLFTRKFEYIWVKSKAVMKMHNTVSPMTAHELLVAFRQADLKKMTDLYMDKKVLRTVGDPYKAKRNTHREPTEFQKATRSFYHSVSTSNVGFREGTTVLTDYPSKGLMKHSERTDHPTQKPLALCQVLAKAYCPPNGVILDPFCGSGTIPLSAKMTGRRYIGIEQNTVYHTIAKKRLDVASYDTDEIRLGASSASIPTLADYISE